MSEEVVEVEDREPSSPLASAPIDPYDDVEYVVEGSEEAANLNPEPEELAGKSKEDLFNQLKQLKSELETTKQGLDPVKAMNSSLQEALKYRQDYQPQQVQSAPREDPEARKQRLNNLFMQDPILAAEEVQRESLRPLVDMMLSTTTTLSKDLALADPSQRQVYDRWSQEVEREVMTMSPVEKAQNPRVYQTAIQRVRSRHTDDIMEDLVSQAVQAKLKELGIDPTSTGKNAPVTPNRTMSRPPTSKSTIVVPKWVVQEADRQGLDPKFYYQHLKENGRIK